MIFAALSKKQRKNKFNISNDFDCFSGHAPRHDRFLCLCPLLDKAGHDKDRVTYTDFCHAADGCNAFHVGLDCMAVAGCVIFWHRGRILI